MAVLWKRTAVAAQGDEQVFRVARPGTVLPTDEHGTPQGVHFRGPTSFPYEFSRALTLASISARQGHALMLHAAGLASADQERALVLVAASRTGKSTAVRRLGGRFGYVTDETVAIDSDLSISPYPKPISLDAPDRPGDKDEHAPDELGLGTTPDRPVVAAMVILVRTDRPGPPDLVPIGLIDGLFVAVKESSALHQLDRPLHRLAQALTVGGGPYCLEYQEIDECADLLDTLLDGASAEPSVTWVGHPPHAEDEPRPAGSGVCRAPWSDAVEADGEIAILIDRQLSRLSPIAASIWRNASTPVAASDLVTAVVRDHGPHPEASVIVEKAVQELLQASVLELR